MRASPTVQPRSPDGAISAATGHHSSTAPAGKPSNPAPIACRPCVICVPPPNAIASSAENARNAFFAPLVTDSAANAESARNSSLGSARPRTCAPSASVGPAGAAESGTGTGLVLAYAASRHTLPVFRQHARYLPRVPPACVQPYVYPSQPSADTSAKAGVHVGVTIVSAVSRNVRI